MTRLRKEIEKTKTDLAHVEGKLSKESFVAKAPKELIEKTKAEALAYQSKLAGFESALKKLGSG